MAAVQLRAILQHSEKDEHVLEKYHSLSSPVDSLLYNQSVVQEAHKLRAL